jgi:hypothetical protein
MSEASAGRFRCAFAGLAVALAGLVLGPASATAAVPAPFAQFGENGSGAGQLLFLGPDAGRGGGIATDPSTGHAFVADLGNNRISEFTAWGEFVKAWGWGVGDGSTAAPQTCAATCFKGLRGSGPGQLDQPDGVAVGAGGEVYVFERENRRVQVFAASGEFLRMFGAGVDETSGADVCTKADLEGGDVCGPGSAGTGPGEFSVEELPGTAGDYIDTGADGTVFVGDRGRIQEFEPGGAFKAALSLPEAGNPGALSIDRSSGDIYFSFSHAQDPAAAFRLSPAGAVIYTLPTSAAEGLTTDAGGTVYATDDPVPGPNGNPENASRLVEIDTLGAIAASAEPSLSIDLPALATNTVTAAGGVDVYVLHGGFNVSGPQFVEVRGPAPDKWPPPLVPPTIAAQYASSVRDEAATVKARINPNFWDDTNYRLEYGTADCAEGGCETTPAGPGILLGAGVVKAPVVTQGIDLSGLTPDTTYHFRFVAESGGGGPVFGPDHTFTTFPSPAPPRTDCPNQAFRTGPSASLSDCRAYEMVSPIDKLGGDVVVQCNTICLPARLDQSAPDGDRITYSSDRSFGDSESAGYTSQYMATRGPGGWSTHGISPPREGPSVYGTNGLDSQYRGFLDDLSSGFLLFDTEPLLAPGAVPGFANLYRRDNLAGGYEALSTVSPVGPGSVDYVLELQGFSADGSRAALAANAKLTPNASAKHIFQVYESFEGGLRLVSVRPNGTAATVDSAVGSVVAVGRGLGRSDNAVHAVSDDGSRIYWSELEGLGKVYVRVGGLETVAVSAGAATFWAATPSGSKAIFTEGEELRLFDLGTKASTPLAPSVQGVLGASDDLSRVYFVSTGALAGGAVAGQPNLYLYEEGSPLTFVATLSQDDFRGEPAVSPTALAPWRRAARVTPDGGAAVFMSRAALTGADNLDAESSEADAEVYRYDAGRDELLCVSCSPTGVRSPGQEYVLNKKPSGYWYASQIPGWEFQLHAPRVISDDGNRVYFDSFNALVLADVNGREDVYEWEAPGSGECSEASADFTAGSGGCVSLVSDGKVAGDSEFVDASSDGRDVFFTTGANLVSQDPAQIDLYDARAGGGFAPPPAPPAECDGEACQPAGMPPGQAPNVSETFVGPPNPKPPPRRHRHRNRHHRRARHPKGKHRHTRRQAGGRGR